MYICSTSKSVAVIRLTAVSKESDVDIVAGSDKPKSISKCT